MNFDFSCIDDVELFLFERVVENLKITHGHSLTEAVRLVNDYHRKFTDAAFCERYNISIQTKSYFCHVEALTMADQVQYYSALGHIPNDEAFRRWQRKFRDTRR